jgi:hypothetical protein
MLEGKSNRNLDILNQAQTELAKALGALSEYHCQMEDAESDESNGVTVAKLVRTETAVVLYQLARCLLTKFEVVNGSTSSESLYHKLWCSSGSL